MLRRNSPARSYRRALTIAAVLAGATVLSTVAQPFQVGEHEDNDDAVTANVHKAIDISRGAINFVGDRDFWLSTGRSGDLVFAYVATLGATPSTNSRLDVRRADGTTLIEADGSNGPGLSSVVAGAVMPDDAVYFDVSETNDDALLSPYRLFALTVDLADSSGEAAGNGTIAGAQPISATMQTGSVSSTDVDYFGFHAFAGDDIVVIVDDDPDNNGA